MENRIKQVNKIADIVIAMSKGILITILFGLMFDLTKKITGTDYDIYNTICGGVIGLYTAAMLIKAINKNEF